MTITLVLSVSVLLQFIAAFLALRLIWVTERSGAWLAISLAILLMGLRRSITLFRLLSGNLIHIPDLTAEFVALIISVLMVVGIIMLAPPFRTAKRDKGVKFYAPTYDSRIPLFVTVMFGLLFALNFLNEFLDISHILLGAPHTPINWLKAIIEMVLVAVIGIYVVSKITRYIVEQKEAEEHIIQLNSVLRAIRNVNQLIAIEKDRSFLLQKICDALIEARGYNAAWLGYLNDDKTFETFVDSGSGKNVSPFIEHVISGEHPHCIGNALNQENRFVVVDKSKECGDCFLKSACSSKETAIMRIEHGNKLLGLLAVSFAPDVAIDEEDKGLLMEVAGDIGFALYSIKLDEARKQAEEALSMEKERLKITISSIGDAVISTDTEGKITLMNKVAEELTGWEIEQAIGKPLNSVFHIINENTGEECENPVEKVMKTGIVIGLANGSILISKDSTRKYIADSGAPIHSNDGNIIGVVLVFRDITEKLKTEQELIKVNQLESLGIFAGGIAHDFNNILTAFLLNVSHAKLLSEGNEKVVDALSDAEKAAMRAKSLTQKLLTFSRGGAPVKETIDLTDTIAESAEFVLSGSNVRCNLSISDDLWFVDADNGQIAQVIQNIVINADQAMPDGGVINISAENTVLGTDEHPIVQPGKYIKISIQDQGVGIPNNYLQEIFNPYFTTKQKGNGLGLSIVYSIVKKHGGYIFVDSAVEQGTTFDIFIPASKKEFKTVQMAETDIENNIGNVLLMDDEEEILNIVGGLLRSYGHKVETALEGEEAIEKYISASKTENPFDVVILDLTIRGGMGGKNTIEKLREIDPNIKAIVSSGYSDDPVMANYKDYGFSAVIAKPYRPQKLREIVSRVIGEAFASF